MKWDIGKRSPSGHSDKGDEDRIAAENEELIHFARQYFATDFPNPDSIGCPPSETLVATVRAGVLPDEELTRHLFTCSVCFNTYRVALAQRRSEELVVAPHWWKHLPERLTAALSRKLVWACASFVVLTAIGFWSRPSRPSVHTPAQAKNEQPTYQTPGLPQPDNNPQRLAALSRPPASPSRRQTISRQKKPSGDMGQDFVALVVDLSDYTAVRSMGAQHQSLQFPRNRLQLKLALPEGGLAGKYVIAVFSGGKELIKRPATSTDGKHLTTMLDLVKIKPGDYLLSLRHKREEYTFPITVIDGLLPTNGTQRRP